jgi:glycine/D-amino acid oxidase-like deaminating enzyme
MPTTPSIHRPPSPDVVVIGGGILGVATGAHLAETGRRVLLLERDQLAAGASGRNSGIVQHPLDPALEALYVATVDLYRRLDDATAGALGMPEAPVGLLSVTHDPAVARHEALALATHFGQLVPAFLDPTELRALEPALAPDVYACRLDIGFPVRPIAATHAYATRARSLGVDIREGIVASPWIEASRVAGVRLDDGSSVTARDVVVAAGPWSPALVDPTGRWQPIRPLWGVVATVGLTAPPRHVAEEAASTIEIAHHAGESGDGAPGIRFSLVTAGGSSSLGSAFLDREPDPEVVARDIIARGARFVPEVASAPAARRAGVCSSPEPGRTAAYRSDRLGGRPVDRGGSRAVGHLDRAGERRAPGGPVRGSSIRAATGARPGSCAKPGVTAQRSAVRTRAWTLGMTSASGSSTTSPSATSSERSLLTL